MKFNAVHAFCLSFSQSTFVTQLFHKGRLAQVWKSIHIFIVMEIFSLLCYNFILKLPYSLKSYQHINILTLVDQNFEPQKALFILIFTEKILHPCIMYFICIKIIFICLYGRGMDLITVRKELWKQAFYSPFNELSAFGITEATGRQPRQLPSCMISFSETSKTFQSMGKYSSFIASQLFFIMNCICKSEWNYKVKPMKIQSNFISSISLQITLCKIETFYYFTCTYFNKSLKDKHSLNKDISTI